MPAVAPQPHVCPGCGAKLPSGTAYCPPCLLRLALAADLPGPPGTDPDKADRSEPDHDTDAAEMPVAPGVFGEYELIAPIGRGAMGAVFKARQTSLDRLVALKILDFAGHLPADAARRFRAEASAAAALRHPGIVTIHDVGVHRGRHFLAMDFVEGSTLAARVAAGPLAPASAATLVAAVADAIQCAHRHGILHRDLKPSNILVDAAGRPHVADFGLAKRMHGDAGMTLPGQIMGSPNYMSPEQARGAALGPASDVHALGALLYHCLAGRPPFLGQTIPDTLREVAEREPVAPRLLAPGIPRDLETIALKCLQKDPAKRYPTAEALADDLQRFLRGEPILARPVRRAERLWRWARRHPALAALSGATAVLVLAVAIGSPIATLRIRAARERAEDNLYAADMNVAQQALDRSSRSQARALLERHRPAAGEADRRGFEWRYLWGQTASDERFLLQAPTGERHLVAIPGTSLLAAGHTVWDLGPPARVVFRLPAGAIAMAFDEGNATLLARGPEGLIAWSTADWRPRILIADEVVHAVAFSPDGRHMATGGERLRLWERSGETWQEIARVPRAFKIWHNAHTLAFSPDGRTLATATGESWANRSVLELWSVPALDPLPAPAEAPRDISSLVFTPDGRQLVAGCWNGRIRIWNLDTREPVPLALRHHGFVSDLAFSPANPSLLASTASDRTVRLWRMPEGTELAALQGPFDQLWAMTFAPDGRTLLTLEQRGRIAAWDTASRRRASELIAQGPCTMPLGFSADGTLLATIDQRGALRFWELARRREVVALAQTIDLAGVLTHDFEIIAPAITRDLERLAIGMTDGRIQLWHLPTRSVETWTAHAGALRNVAFSPDARTLATVANDGHLKLWDVASRELRAGCALPMALPSEDFNVPLVWTGNGRTIAVAGIDAITLHEGATTRIRHTLQSERLAYSMRFSPDGRTLVSAQEDFLLAFWDAERGTRLDLVSTGHQEGVYDLSFTPDGRTLASAVDQVKLWNVATRQEVATLRGHERNIFAALFSPDGNALVTADYQGAVRVWVAPPFDAIDGR